MDDINHTSEIAKILKKNRIEQNITQAALADWVGIHERTLRKYENPRFNKKINYKTMLSLIKELDINCYDQMICLGRI